MKMMMVIIPRDEAEKVLQALVAADHTATYLETRGGMLRQAQMTLFIGVREKDLEEVLSIIDAACHSQATVESSEPVDVFSVAVSAKPRLGGAVVFIWNIERSETF